MDENEVDINKEYARAEIGRIFNKPTWTISHEGLELSEESKALAREMAPLFREYFDNNKQHVRFAIELSAQHIEHYAREYIEVMHDTSGPAPTMQEAVNGLRVIVQEEKERNLTRSSDEMSIKSYEIEGRVRNEVAVMFKKSPVDVIDYDLEPSVESRQFAKKAEAIFSEKFGDDHVAIAQGVRLATQQAELEIRNTKETMKGLPGAPVTNEEAAKAALPDIERDAKKKREIAIESADLEAGANSGAATISNAAPEKTPDQEISQQSTAKADTLQSPSPEPEQSERARVLDRLRHSVENMHDVYRSPHLHRKIIETNERGITVHGSSDLASRGAIEIAQERGWSSIRVEGSESTRRAIWLSAQEQGMKVIGYEPTPNDLSIVANLKGPSATIENSAAPRVAVDQPPKPSAKETESEVRTMPAAQPQKANLSLSGELIEFGKAPFKDDPNKNPSSYAVIEDKNGVQQKAWGADIHRAIQASEAQLGDTVTLGKTGERTTVKVPVEVKEGNALRIEYQTHERNEWAVTINLKGKEHAQAKVQEKVAEMER